MLMKFVRRNSFFKAVIMLRKLSPRSIMQVFTQKSTENTILSTNATRCEIYISNPNCNTEKNPKDNCKQGHLGFTGNRHCKGLKNQFKNLEIIVQKHSQCIVFLLASYVTE